MLLANVGQFFEGGLREFSVLFLCLSQLCQGSSGPDIVIGLA